MEFEYNALNSAAPVAYATFKAMNTVVEIVIVHLPEVQARGLCEGTESLVLELETKLSRHISGSAFQQINASQGAGDIEVEEQVYWLLELCEAMRRATDGYFDIAALSDDRTRPAYTTDPSGQAVRTVSPGILLDAGAFAKGYALDKLKPEFEAAGVDSALLNFGDSSILAMGTHPFGDCWPVTAGNTRIELRDTALSVSGIAPSGKAHIVDPHTGLSAASGKPVVVKGRSALVCEILSTALYAAPVQKRTHIAASFEGYEAATEEMT